MLTTASRRSLPRAAVLPLVLLVLSILVTLVLSPPVPRWEGEGRLAWSELRGFVNGQQQLEAPALPSSEPAVIGWREPGPAKGNRRAESLPFTVKGPLMEISVAGLLAPGLSRSPTVAVVGLDGEVLSDESIPLRAESIQHLGWTPFRLALPASAVGKEARLIFRTKPSATPAGWVALRERIDFYSLPSVAVLYESRTLGGVLFLGFAALAGISLIRLAAVPRPRGVLAIAFLAVSLVLQLRTSVYIYWDEWHVLERFSQLGFGGVVYTHNEHFLPLFFTWLFAEARIFGDSYLAYIFVSCGLHALNGWLVYELLSRLGEGRKGTRQASVLLAAAFVASSLHGEALQWAFEQSLLISQALTLAASCLVWDFMRRGERSRAGFAAACCFAAPLCFGNGFFALIQAGLVAVTALLGAELSVSGRDGSREGLRRIAIAGATALLGTAAAAWLYSIYQSSSGHGASELTPFSDPLALARYLYVGTQLGAILRGLGLFPFLELTAPAKGLAALGVASDSPEMLLAHLGLLINIALLVFARRAAVLRGWAIRLWILAQCLLFGPMLLPSLARWQLGVSQSLSLRYHYSTLFGLAVALLPVVSAACATRSVLLRRVGASLLVCWLTAQLLTARGFDYFSGLGASHRAYLPQLVDWEAKLAALRSTNPSVSFEANGTELSGMQPAHPQTLTPGRHPEQIYAVLRWLSPRRFP